MEKHTGIDPRAISEVNQQVQAVLREGGQKQESMSGMMMMLAELLPSNRIRLLIKTQQ